MQIKSMNGDINEQCNFIKAKLRNEFMCFGTKLE